VCDGRLSRYEWRPSTRSKSDGQLLVLLEKVAQPPDAYAYQLIATQRTATTQKEMNQAAAQGFHLLPGNMIGGRGKIVLLLERAPGPSVAIEYLLLATNQNSTLQKEIEQSVNQGLPRGGHDQPRREHRNPRKTRRN
jgi:hypothetical protein